MNTSIQDQSRTSPFTTTKSSAKSLFRTDSAEHTEAPRGAAKSQAKRPQNGPRGGKNDSAYEGPKAGSLTQGQRQKVAFLIRQGEHALSQLDTQLPQAMQRATASGYHDGVAVARRNALSNNKAQIAGRVHALRALLAGNQLPALQDAMGMAKAAMDLASPDAAAPRARYDVVTAAVAQHAAEK